MVVYPDDIWYSPKTQEDMEEILTEHIQNDRVVERLVIPFKKK
jgi:(2Fe-2S) ferredoxin